MKILHCCLAAFYIDGYGYQENILPKIHKELGHDVQIVSSTETYLNNTKLGYISAGTYYNEDGIKVTRIPYVNWIPHLVAKKLRIYKGLEKKLYSFKPDLIYLHDCQFLSIGVIVRYARNNECKIVVDSHTDFINSARSWISKNILHKGIYKLCAQWVLPYTDKFYGTLPARNDFLRDVYGIPENKIELLEFGFDDNALSLDKFTEVRKEVRHKLGINSNETIFLAGGKIDGRKNYLNLIEAYKELNSHQTKLIIFGKPTPEIENEFHQKINSNNILYLGWLNRDEINELLVTADMAIFPGTHSVLWEQAVGAGTPCIFKRWKGIQHIDIGGNCLFLNEGDTNELKSVLTKVINNDSILPKMKQEAIKEERKRFLYTEIAKRVID